MKRPDAGDTVGFDQDPTSGPVASPNPRRLAGAAGFLGLSQALQYVLRLATSLILARLLVPRDFGLLGIVGVLIVLLQRTVVDGGMVNALVQREEVTQELRSSVFFVNIVSGVLTTGILVAAAHPIASVLGDGSAAGVLRGIALSFLIMAFAKVPEATLRRDMRYNDLAVLNSVSALITGLVAVPLAVLGWGVSSIVIGQVMGSVAETLCVWVLARWRPSFHFALKDVREISHFSSRLTAFNFVNYFGDAGDKFIVGRFVGTTALGYYNLPYRLLFAPVLAIAQVFHDLFFPLFARRQHDPASIARAYARSVGVLSLATFPLCGITAALGTPLVDAFLGAKWHPAGSILSVMAVVVLLQSVLVTTGVLLSSTGRTDVLFRWGLVAGTVMPISYVAGVHWGALGVACGFLAGTVVLSYPAIAISFRPLGAKMKPFFLAMWPQAAATAAAVAVTLACRLVLEGSGFRPIAVVLAAGLAGALVFGLLLVLLWPPALNDVLLVVRRRGIASAADAPADSRAEPASVS